MSTDSIEQLQSLWHVIWIFGGFVPWISGIVAAFAGAWSVCRVR